MQRPEKIDTYLPPAGIDYFDSLRVAPPFPTVEFGMAYGIRGGTDPSTARLWRCAQDDGEKGRSVTLYVILSVVRPAANLK